MPREPVEEEDGADLRSGLRMALGRWGVGALLLAACVCLYLIESWRIGPQVDDAFISYRYARNLVEGLGLVYNAGEYVEGFTNLLWTLLLAGGIALGGDAVELGHFMGLASGVGVLVATCAYARGEGSDSPAWLAALAPWIPLASVGFVYWSVSGMETLLFVAFVVVALVAFARGRVGWTTLWVSLATLTRPEGVLLGAVVFGFHVLGGARAALPRRLRAPLVYGGVLVAQTAFRLAYYGSPVPNTFYAKVSGVPIVFGIAYLLEVLRDGAGFLLVPAAFALARPAWRPGAAWVVLMSAYVVAIGGDALGYSRFLLPVVPCLSALAVGGALVGWRWKRPVGVALGAMVAAAPCWYVFGGAPLDLLAGVGLVAAGLGAARLARPALAPVVGVGLAAAVALFVLVGWPGLATPFDERWAESKRSRMLTVGRENAEWFRGLMMAKVQTLLRRDEPNRLVAVIGIGRVGYYSRLPILDLVGLVDPVIARSDPRSDLPGLPLPGHQRSNAAYVLEREPDYILVGRKRSEGSLLLAHSDLWRHPDFERSYVWDSELRGYRRRDLDPPDPPPDGR